MEELTDRPLPPHSPTEWAIHFLLRHKACRNALTEQAANAFLHQASAAPASGAGRDVADSRPPALPVPGVTGHDSCAARFSRAYAAARHTSTSGTA